jgi:hypothetical protein
MQQAVEGIRIHLNKLRQGVVTCIYCGVQRTINMAKYPDYHSGDKALQFKCSICQKPFYVRFDLRRYHRIVTDLPGQLRHAKTGQVLPPITVESLSVGGVGFRVAAPTDIRVGEMYHIAFELDDDEGATICETVHVKRVQEDFIGAEFFPHDKYHHELDFYVLANVHIADF